MATVKSALNGKAVEVANAAESARASKGLMFERYFTDGKISPFDAVEWEKRTALIGNEKGVTIFKQENVEVPKGWSQTATNIVASKYFHGKPGSAEREGSARQLISRVVNTHRTVGRRRRLFREQGITRRVSRRTDAPAGRAEDELQFAGMVQRRRAAEATVLGVLHQFRARQHGIDHGSDQDGRNAVQVGLRERARISRRCAAARKRFRVAGLHRAR